VAGDLSLRARSVLAEVNLATAESAERIRGGFGCFCRSPKSITTRWLGWRMGLLERVADTTLGNLADSVRTESG
jgi:hypothetical protein